MNTKCEVLIQIGGKKHSSKHAELLTDYLINRIEELDEIEIITKINPDYNFNISVDNVEIFSKFPMSPPPRIDLSITVFTLFGSWRFPEACKVIFPFFVKLFENL